MTPLATPQESGGFVSSLAATGATTGMIQAPPVPSSTPNAPPDPTISPVLLSQSPSPRQLNSCQSVVDLTQSPRKKYSQVVEISDVKESTPGRNPDTVSQVDNTPSHKTSYSTSSRSNITQNISPSYRYQEGLVIAISSSRYPADA